MSNESVCGNCETIQRFYGKKKKVNYPKVKQKKERLRLLCVSLCCPNNVSQNK